MKFKESKNNEVFELFQSAWSGAKVAEEDELNKRDFQINKISIDGKRKKVFCTNDNKNFLMTLFFLVNIMSQK